MPLPPSAPTPDAGPVSGHRRLPVPLRPPEVPADHQGVDHLGDDEVVLPNDAPSLPAQPPTPTEGGDPTSRSPTGENVQRAGACPVCTRCSYGPPVDAPLRKGHSRDFGLTRVSVLAPVVSETEGPAREIPSVRQVHPRTVPNAIVLLCPTQSPRVPPDRVIPHSSSRRDSSTTRSSSDLVHVPSSRTVHTSLRERPRRRTGSDQSDPLYASGTSTPLVSQVRRYGVCMPLTRASGWGNNPNTQNQDWLS